MAQALLKSAPLVMATAMPAAQTPPLPDDLSAVVRISEVSTSHNAYPDDCDMRLQRLYIAEDLQLSIQVQFSRALTDEESQLVQWQVTNGAAEPASGDFVGQSNPASITTTVTAAAARGSDEPTVRITYAGADLAPPSPMRVVSNAEYDAAYAALTGYLDRRDRTANRLPLTADLLARFLGQDSDAAGIPSVTTEPLNICDPRLTHRAGADWGPDVETAVPHVEYASDQPAAQVVSQGVAVALLSDKAEEIRSYFAAHPGETTHDFEYAYSGNLTLNDPPDALFALHGVQFDGSVSASVATPATGRRPLQASAVQVNGTVMDVYDFDLGAGGAGALPAQAAAQIEIASVKHDIGKVFLVAFDLDNALDAVTFDRV